MPVPVSPGAAVRQGNDQIPIGLPATQVTQVTTTSSQQTILVVDDERFIVSLLTEILEEEGYLVRIANDGEAALQEIAAARPDLVVADIMMPRLDGLTLAATIRSWQQPIPVILMSAAVTPRSQGVSFIPKPFDIDDLLIAVGNILGPPPTHHG